jgi:hypothetical protein
MSSPAGWYPDPTDEEAWLRWWDGARWTDQVRAIPVGAPSSAWRVVMILTAVIAFIGTGAFIVLMVLASLAHPVQNGNK